MWLFESLWRLFIFLLFPPPLPQSVGERVHRLFVLHFPHMVELSNKSRVPNKRKIHKFIQESNDRLYWNTPIVGIKGGCWGGWWTTVPTVNEEPRDERFICRKPWWYGEPRHIKRILNYYYRPLIYGPSPPAHGDDDGGFNLITQSSPSLGILDPVQPTVHGAPSVAIGAHSSVSRIIERRRERELLIMY